MLDTAARKYGEDEMQATPRTTRIHSSGDDVTLLPERLNSLAPIALPLLIVDGRCEGGHGMVF